MRKIILYGVIVIQIAIVISLIRGIQLSKRSAGRIAVLQNTKQELERERDRLIEERKYVESEFYLEKVARDELHLSKEGETVVLVPGDREIGLTEDTTPKEESNDSDKPNWKKWVQVFSGND